jgi:hypothetical protein
VFELFDVEKPKAIEEDEPEEKKKVTIFSYIQDITTGKKGNIHVKDDPSMKEFNSFMILKFLSLDDGYVPLMNILNETYDALSKEELYHSLIHLIPRSRKFLQYPKAQKNDINEEHVEVLKRYFKCSKEDALDFIKLHLISEYEIERIQEMYGGKK